MRYLRITVVAAVLLMGCAAAATDETAAPASPDPVTPVTGDPDPSPAATSIPTHAVAPAPSPQPSEAMAGRGPFTVPDEQLEAPEAVAARAFVEAVGAGDFDAAWELLGPRSQAELGSRDALEQDASALAEGWGAWAHSPDAMVFRSAVLAASGEGRLSVVTFTGTVMQEGVTERRTVAAPAWSQGDSDDPAAGRFEPFASGREPLIIEDPVESGTVACDAVVIAARGPMEHAMAVASINGDATFTPDFDTELAEPGRIVFPVDAALSPGEHVLTFALTTDAGRPYADAVRFTVEPPC